MINEEKIYYESTDNIKLCGLLSNVNNNNNKIVILCHGLKGDKTERDSFIAFTEKLQEKRYNSFRFDFRGHGESTGNDYEMTITKEIEDLESTINMLKQKGYTEIALLGASFGASIISLLNCSKYKEIKGLICWYGALDYKETIEDDSFFSDKHKKIAEEIGYYSIVSQRTGKVFKLGLPLYKEVDQYVPYANLIKTNLPILFVHGKVDTMVPYQLSEKVSALCKNSRIELIENGDHTFNNSGIALNKAIEKTIEFIEEIM